MNSAERCRRREEAVERATTARGSRSPRSAACARAGSGRRRGGGARGRAPTPRVRRLRRQLGRRRRPTRAAHDEAAELRTACRARRSGRSCAARRRRSAGRGTARAAPGSCRAVGHVAVAVDDDVLERDAARARGRRLVAVRPRRCRPPGTSASCARSSRPRRGAAARGGRPARPRRRSAAACAAGSGWRSPKRPWASGLSPPWKSPSTIRKSPRRSRRLERDLEVGGVVARAVPGRRPVREGSPTAQRRWSSRLLVAHLVPEPEARAHQRAEQRRERAGRPRATRSEQLGRRGRRRARTTSATRPAPAAATRAAPRARPGRA